MKRALFAGFASLCLFGTFVAMNSAAGAFLGAVRIDVTQDQLYTLSDQTRSVLAALEEPVVLDLYVSREAAAADPAARAHAAQIRDLLHSYASAARGRVRLVEHDPAPFSTAEDTALAEGLVPLESEDAGAVGSTAPLYLGLVARNSVDERAAIPAFDPARADRLEYDITRLIADISGQPRGHVALITSLPWLVGQDSGGAPPGPVASVFQDLADVADITVLPPDFDELPPQTGLIMLVQPPPLSPWQQYLIDQQVLRDGRAIVALDPASLTAAEGGGDVSATGSLGALAAAWGIEVSAEVVMDRSGALPVRTGSDGRMRELPQPLVFAVPPAALAAGGPVTAILGRPVHLVAPGEVRDVAPVPGERRVLLQSSADTMRIDPRRALAAPEPAAILGAWESSGQSVALGLDLQRASLASAFASGPPPVPQRSGERLELYGPLRPDARFIAERREPARIIVFGDADFLADGFYRSNGQDVADNGALLVSAVDALGGGGSLAGLRARAPRDRPLAVVDAIRQRAGARLAEDELRIQTRIETARARLAELEASGASGASDGMLAPAAASELEAVRDELLDARQRLRAIQDGARRETGAIKAWLLGICAGLVPALVLIAGLLLGLRRDVR